MRARAAVWNLLGPTVMVLALAFLPAGVRVARADAEPPPAAAPPASPQMSGEAGSAAVCSTDGPSATPRRAAGVAAQVVERLRRATGTEDADFVVLNGRGHNSPRAGEPAASLGAIDAELRRTSHPRR
jgi:hypothetical protein